MNLVLHVRLFSGYYKETITLFYSSKQILCYILFRFEIFKSNKYLEDEENGVCLTLAESN